MPYLILLGLALGLATGIVYGGMCDIIQLISVIPFCFVSSWLGAVAAAIRQRIRGANKKGHA
jgi:hypothetical protein